MSVDHSTKFWDDAAQSYSKSAVSDEIGYQRTLDRTRSYLKSIDRLLKLGCGTGSSALLIADGVQSFLATDISPEMIKIANEKHATRNYPIAGLSFRAAIAETLASEGHRFSTVVGFNYFHLVSDVTATLRAIHSLLDDGGLLITKTACLADSMMYSWLAYLALPVAPYVGKAPALLSMRATELQDIMRETGFEILTTEMHASKGIDIRPFIVARKVENDTKG